ncbi:hypothetical protein HJC23_012363 [Cyclotella cryptica]|uniref:Uncharacterized protein n=1 Tax=Cyclotella cryptica TaxID=29204 RepID=A0ABD3QCK3_9STRA|eukprot:CCRYP_006579-RA/>CCRYP_006579-RA protein AED:0.15 eAED:0.15 QI:0/-1/0/1/-1/1/1/0/356
MSSLAATQADGYYIPPSYYASGAYKSKSISQHAGSKGHNQYLTHSIARFELPYDGFCTKCHAIVGKGTRFNAHKAHVGDYFTSKIYEFTTKCRACAACEFKIRTNPKEQSFDYVVGIRKKVEEFDSVEAGTHGVIDTDIGAGIYQYKDGKLLDAEGEGGDAALHALEKMARGHRKALTEHEHMESLIQINTKMEEDADANANLRAGYRKERKAKKRRLEDAKSRGLGRGIFFEGETGEDVATAREVMTIRDRRKERDEAYRSEKKQFISIRGGSIFSSHKRHSSKTTLELDKIRQNEESTRKSAEAMIENGTRMKKKILVCPKNIEKGTRIEVKDVKSNSSHGVISALADYGSDSD